MGIALEGARTHLVDDDSRPRSRNQLGQLLDRPHTSRHAHRVAAADQQDLIAALQRGYRRTVATRRQGVVGELLVLLDREPAVDDRERGELPGLLDDVLPTVPVKPEEPVK